MSWLGYEEAVNLCDWVSMSGVGDVDVTLSSYVDETVKPLEKRVLHLSSNYRST